MSEVIEKDSNSIASIDFKNYINLLKEENYLRTDKVNKYLKNPFKN